MEEWKQIKDFPDYYVSNKGVIKSKRKILKPVKQINKRKGEYYYVTLFKNKKPKVCSIARIVAKTFIPNPDNKPNVDHINRNTKNNSVENLRWVTQSENLLNPNTVRHRSMFFNNKKAVDVAKENGIPKTTFYRRIKLGWQIKDACHLPQRTYKKRS